MNAPRLILASMSPRRSALLEQIGVAHRVSAPHIDERVLPGEAPRAHVLRLAREKALTVARTAAGVPVLAADTIVVIDGLILGKPADLAAGVAMLRRLGGRTHEVLTAVALVSGGEPATRLSVSEVRMRAVSEAECRAYWHTGEPLDKAGGYAVQGRGAVFIESIRGSYSGIMGLPLYETAELLAAAGLPVLQ
ncbi:MAG: septum formation inhibitor Maf [Gammaproteobacteria bacterium]|nr:septum formation inhibitor Maf [Gammaproteobacteria bacterium]MBV9696523.1 septum formation inhibitor Maf [Gammaproteobacteria bacterium]